MLPLSPREAVLGTCLPAARCRAGNARRDPRKSQSAFETMATTPDADALTKINFSPRIFQTHLRETEGVDRVGGGRVTPGTRQDTSVAAWMQVWQLGCHLSVALRHLPES